jgi:hypothetical protein
MRSAGKENLAARKAFSDALATHASTDELMRLNNEQAAASRAAMAAQSHYESLTSPAGYFDGLPAAVAQAKTDADGKFSMSLPVGDYVLAAATSRAIFKDMEQYYWLVKLDPNDQSQSLMLSNDNMVQTKCRECIPLPAPDAK